MTIDTRAQATVASQAEPRRPARAFFYSLDGIRGVAALLVVLRHITPFFQLIDFQESYLAVDVFFVLSGVVLRNSYESRLRRDLSVRRFCVIRLVRLYPLYLAGSVIGCLALAREGTDAIHLVFYAALGLLFLPSPLPGSALYPFDGPAWSLFFELAVNFVYARFLSLLNTRVISLVMAVSALALVLAIVLSPDHSLDVGWTRLSFIGGFPRVAFSFFAGVLMARYYLSHQRHIALPGWVALCAPWIPLALTALVLTAAPPPVLQPYFDFAAITMIFPAAVFVGLWFQPGRIGQSVDKFLGVISYAIYVLHRPLAGFFHALMTARVRTFVDHHAPWPGIAFLAVLILICWGLDYAYDQPVRRWLLRLDFAPARRA
jgi:peptidoglycan/LPS O-acetylase OafA/YrhL